MKFALELFVPEKLMQAGRNSAPPPERDVSPEPAPNETRIKPALPAPQREARSVIEELDHAQFGGPSFGPQTIELLSTAMEAAAAALDEPATDAQLRLIAATLLKAAGDGERDPARLKTIAMSGPMSGSMSGSISALGPVIGSAQEQPPTT